MAHQFTALALALLALVLSTQAAPFSAKKCIPMQWEAAALGKVAQVAQGKGQVFDLIARVSGDYKRKAEATVTSIFADGKPVASNRFLRTSAASYLIDTMNKKCYKLPNGPVEQICTDSKGLNYIASMTIGDQMVDTYKIARGGADSTLTMLRDSFTPVGEVIQQEIHGIPQMIAFQFGNVTMGIKDPKVFDVPSYC